MKETNSRQFDLQPEAKGWASLPPESRAALYPLLQKERHTGRDIARILMFNAIASYNDNRVLDEDAIRSMAASMTDAGWKVYNKYMAAFFVLSNSTELVTQMTKSIRIICDYLGLHIENAVHENIFYPDCSPLRYDINAIANFEKGGEIHKSIYTYNEWHNAWKEGNEIITNCAIERIMFKIAGMTLNVPGLEAMLNCIINGLKHVLESHNKTAMEARKMFLALDLPEKSRLIAMNWTKPLFNIDSLTVPDTTLKKAKRALRLENFAYDYSRLDRLIRDNLNKDA